MYDIEFAKEFKEEIELDEMKWAVGGVYHQEFKNGDKAYFRADSVQKNKRWKGMQVDEFGGRQKKAKNATANENLPGWVTTPKNEIPKGLKEEVEIDEGKFKKGDIVIPNMGPHKGDKHKIIHDFGDGSYNIKPLMHPRNIKYKLGAVKAKGNQLKLVKEEVELDEEVADIAIRKDVGKMGKNQVAAKVMTNARKLFGLKASVNGEYVRISGSKKKVNDYLDVIIGRSSSGDATQKGPSNPQIDKMLTKGLKKEEVEATRMPMEAPFVLDK